MRLMNLLITIALGTLLVRGTDDVAAADKKPKVDKNKKPKVNPHPANHANPDASIIVVLRSAFHLLDASKVSYGDHRKKGMTQIQHAIVALEQDMHKRGLKPHAHRHPGPQANASADALLVAGHNQLMAAGAELTKLHATPLRTKAINHLKLAGTELMHARALARDHGIVYQLRHAHKILAKAEPIYAGYRGKAMQEINASIGDLERELHQRGMKDHSHKQYQEPAFISDLQVKHTHSALIVTLKELASLPPTGWRQSAGGHLSTAIANLGKALSMPRDHVLVAHLRSIYKLLDKADGIYNGHRVKAMDEINHAIGNLEKEMHAHGLKPHMHDHAWEPEAVSNWQVRHAHRALKHVEARLALHPKSDLRKKADGHLKASLHQLKLALDVVKNDSK